MKPEGLLVCWLVGFGFFYGGLGSMHAPGIASQ